MNGIGGQGAGRPGDGPEGVEREALLRRWRGLVDDRDEIAIEILARYREPWRHYHDVRHLTDVLAGIDVLRRHCPDPATVELAGWFHDAVYLVPGVDGATAEDTAQNEERSARLARERLAEALPDSIVTEVVRLVRLTVTHDPAPDDPNGSVLCDADLAVLARPAAAYDRYCGDVRREYAHVPDDAFRTGRLAALRALTRSDRLYRTDAGCSLWERAARANLDREMDALASGAALAY